MASLPVNPGLSVDFVLDFRYERVIITFSRKNHDERFFCGQEG